MKQEAAPCSSSSSSTTDDLEATATSSSVPSRILFIKNNTWVDLPHQLFQKLRHGFSFGKPIQEIEFGGSSYTFDFHKLVQIDSRTGAENPIAWIDIHGQFFFPIPPTNSNETSTVPKFSGAEELREDGKLYEVVGRLFKNGMKRDGANCEVVKVYKCTFPSDREKIRMKTFDSTIETMKAVRGDANVRYGWFRGSSESVAAVVKHGFGRCNNGVPLSSPHSPYQSSILSEEDENGERHMVLCRVIRGNSEKVEEGSSQCHVKAHILPEYIVTFKAARNDKLLRRRAPSVVAGLCFRKLLVEMGGNLPSAQLRTLEVLYRKYKTGRMSKDVFIRHLRAVAGDKLLASSVRRIRGC